MYNNKDRKVEAETSKSYTSGKVVKKVKPIHQTKKRANKENNHKIKEKQNNRK